MWNGIVILIHIAPTVGAPMVSRNSIRAVAGQGLEGDWYFLGDGYYSWFVGPLREVSLIEAEVLTTAPISLKLYWKIARSFAWIVGYSNGRHVKTRNDKPGCRIEPLSTVRV